MPLVKVVFPLPSSPVSKTRTGAVSRFANSRPQFVVSSAECVMISSATELNLPKEGFPGVRNELSNFMRENAGRISLQAQHLRRDSVQINAQRQHAHPVLGAKLRREC